MSEAPLTTKKIEKERRKMVRNDAAQSFKERLMEEIYAG